MPILMPPTAHAAIIKYSSFFHHFSLKVACFLNHYIIVNLLFDNILSLYFSECTQVLELGPIYIFLNQV